MSALRSHGYREFSDHLGNQDKILQEGALEPLCDLASFSNGDLETQRYACFALVNAACARQNHPQLVQAGVLRLFVHLMEADDVELRNSATFGCATLHRQLRTTSSWLRRVPFVACQTVWNR